MKRPEWTKEETEEINGITETIVKALDCDKIYLFGSYAYGRPRLDSDLDIYVIYSDESLKPASVRAQIRHLLLEFNKHRPLDILAAHKSSFNEMSEAPTLQQLIKEKGLVLYDKDFAS